MKYFKPKSLTWWTAALTLVLGLVLALGPVIPDGGKTVSVINNLTGGLPPAVLINAGLMGIGLRGAVNE